MSSCAYYADWKGAGRRLRFWRPWEVVAIVAALILFWPVGVGLLVWKCMNYPHWQDFRAEFDRKFGRSFGGGSGRPQWGGGFGGPRHRPTGNSAFEDYRERELARLEEERRRLEEESRAFAEFVEELKRARDREEFDAFMARRRSQGEQNAPGAA